MYKRIVLKNGLRIILAPKKENLTTTVLVLVEAGSKYETKEINGLSHFLEHMCFKGTEKRSGKMEIASDLDNIGAGFNAFTSQEYTGYYARAENKHFEKMLDVISDIYLNSTFPEAEIEKERGVIIEEINMYEDLPQRRVQEIFTKLLYGDQPAGWDIAGEKEVIRKLKRSDFIKYRKNHYVASATTVVIAGNFNEKQAVLKIKERFSEISKDKKKGKKKVKESQSEPNVVVKNKKSDQAHLVLGVRAFSAFDKRRRILGIMSGVLGGGMSSRLFEKLREEMGVAYYVRSESDLLTDHGVFQISAGVDVKRIKEVVKVLVGELKKLKDAEVTDEELARVKNRITGGLSSSLETSEDLAQFFGSQEIMGKKIDKPADIIKEVKKITAKDIKKLAGQILKNKGHNLAVIGPYDKKMEKDLRNILKL